MGVGLLSARGAEPVGAGQSEVDSVQAVLVEYLAAVRERSCPRLIAVSARMLDQAQCEEELREFIERRAEFNGVSQLVRDGRNARVWLATVTLKAAGRERSIVLRVSNGRTGWRVQA